MDRRTPEVRHQGNQVAPVAAPRDGTRERFLDALASLRRQNELHEKRMPLRSPAAPRSVSAEDVSRIGHTAASLVRNVPSPARLKELAEHPERVPFAAAKEVATRLGPIGAPVTKAIDGIAKQIDRASGADHDR
jgi:hypothetical protein